MKRIFWSGVVAHASAISVSEYLAGDDRFDSEMDVSKVASAQVATSLEEISDLLLDSTTGPDTNVGEAMRVVEDKMDIPSAVKVMEHKELPADVQHLVQTVGKGEASSDLGFSAQFSEESLAKARRALNDLVEKAWVQLDELIFKAKGFQDMNRANYGQVTRDALRLVEQINDLERIEAEALAGIQEKEDDIKEVEGVLAKETRLYNTEYAENRAELTIRQNDLDVFQFILVFTKCEDATSLAQVNTRVCQMKSGRHTFLFADKQAQKKYFTMLTPSARKHVDGVLRSFAPALVQAGPASNSTTPAPVSEKKAAVVGEDGLACEQSSFGDEDECMKACSPDSAVECGLLHDKLSLMWGEFKDQVDEKTMEMMKNEMTFEELKENLNGQIALLTKAKTRFTQLLAEARSNLASDRAEQKEKGKQKRKLDKQYYSKMRAFKKKITWIMYQDMCAIKIVRNAVMENSTVCPGAKIQDCDLDAWVPQQCSVSCDDSCDPAQPFKCGGWQLMTRQIVVGNDECGIRCSALIQARYKRCGQFLCPINCAMSTWSGWSGCTAECEGGLQSHTRDIRVKPKNGGQPCNTVEESRPCNTFSCDRNCRLKWWTKWSPCTVACGGGEQEHFRHVLIPTRGEGKCAKPKSYKRYSSRRCNRDKCQGDEICVANQDLVIAVDSSGSIRPDGFPILKRFVSALIERYRTKYWGVDRVKIGIVLFGNGVIMPDGKTVSPAINAQPLTFSMTDVNTAVDGLPFKKGFTNMAQAFAMAEDMFTKGSRKGGQASVLIVTDGKPSFSFMTNEMVQQLDDKSILRYFFVVSEDGPTSDAMMLMKNWASQPWSTNFLHVMGLTLLDADRDLWAEKALTMFCPMAISPKVETYHMKLYGYQKVRDGAWCGGPTSKLLKNYVLSRRMYSVRRCAGVALKAGYKGFLKGNFFRKRYCVASLFETTEAQYAEWATSAGKTNPTCPEGDGWRRSMLYSFYALEPAASREAAVTGA